MTTSLHELAASAGQAILDVGGFNPTTLPENATFAVRLDLEATLFLGVEGSIGALFTKDGYAGYYVSVAGAGGADLGIDAQTAVGLLIGSPSAIGGLSFEEELSGFIGISFVRPWSTLALSDADLDPEAINYGSLDLTNTDAVREFASRLPEGFLFSENLGSDVGVNGEVSYTHFVPSSQGFVDSLRLQYGQALRDIWQKMVDGARPQGPCFSVGTPILLADGASVAIEDIRVGDCVAVFDERDAGGTGALTSGVVTRLIPGITTEWIVLDDGSRVTPNHRYLTEQGTWMTAGDLIASDARAVAADGSFVSLTGTLLRATDADSDATWITPESEPRGNTLLQPAPVLGWRTYNFEVADLHTYVAANDNAGTFQMLVAQAGGV